MPKLLMLRGLPGSGKSAHAKELVAKGGWTRVNNDDLRDSFHNGKWSKNNEQLITKIRHHIIVEALSSGFNVGVDNLNLHPKYELGLKELAKQRSATFESKFFDTPVEECVKRDLQRERSVGKDVITSWYNDYLAPKPEVYTPPEGKPNAIMVDIDGTLAHMKGRSPYDWAKVGSDEPDFVIRDIIWRYHMMAIRERPEILIVSGRDIVCRPETEEWLGTFDIPYDELYMRPEGDKRKDNIVKREIFNNHIRDNYNVLFVMDDRDQVVKMWRLLGLKCLQVAEGGF